MSRVRTACVNILERSTVTIEAGTEDPDHPLSRLYDRNVGRMFSSLSATTIEVKVDQGGSGSQAVDRLMIPAGHNLAGMTLDIMHSNDDIAYTPAVLQWAAVDGLIEKTWQPLLKRYWKFTITTPASIPEMAELFLTSTYEWARNPSRPAGTLDRKFNIEHSQTASGVDRFLVMGGPRRLRSYVLPGISMSQKDELIALNESWSGSRPFWLMDHEGNWIFGTLTEPMSLKETAFGRFSGNFNFREVLG